MNEHLSLDHVDPARSQLSDAVIDVDHALPLSHVQHDVDHDETACPARSRTAERTITKAKKSFTYGPMWKEKSYENQVWK